MHCDVSRPASSDGVNGFNTAIGLKDNGSAVYLFDPNGQLLDFVEFGAQVPGFSIGKISGNWALLASASPDAVNGSAATLADVVGHYDRVLTLRLTDQEKRELVEYLKSL